MIHQHVSVYMNGKKHLRATEGGGGRISDAPGMFRGSSKTDGIRISAQIRFGVKPGRP